MKSQPLDEMTTKPENIDTSAERAQKNPIAELIREAARQFDFHGSGPPSLVERLLDAAEEIERQEPVGWQFYQDGKWCHGDDRIKDHRKNTEEAGYPIREVYATPQPAPDVQGEPVAVMYEDGSLLSKADCGDSFDICCKVQTPLYTTPQPTEQKPAPDVSALVEALEGLMRLESRGRIMPVGPEWDAARSALAAFRQGGGE